MHGFWAGTNAMRYDNFCCIKIILLNEQKDCSLPSNPYNSIPSLEKVVLWSNARCPLEEATRDSQVDAYETVCYSRPRLDALPQRLVLFVMAGASTTLLYIQTS